MPARQARVIRDLDAALCLLERHPHAPHQHQAALQRARGALSSLEELLAPRPAGYEFGADVSMPDQADAPLPMHEAEQILGEVLEHITGEGWIDAQAFTLRRTWGGATLLYQSHAELSLRQTHHMVDFAPPYGLWRLEGGAYEYDLIIYQAFGPVLPEDITHRIRQSLQRCLQACLRAVPAPSGAQQSEK